jgi:hypothetical protein
MEARIEEAIRKTRRYWYEDGLAEIGAGGLFALIGALFFLEAIGRPHRIFAGVSAIGLPALVIGGQMALSRLIRRAKERYVHPRTGYAAAPRPKPIRIAAALAIGVTLAGLIVVVAVSGKSLDTVMVALQGAIFAAVLLAMAVSFGVARFYCEAALVALCGSLLASAGIERLLSCALFFCCAGAIMMIAGGLAFRRYFRSAPAASAGADG